ncbi:hypothetical protein DAETH_46370 (plasmid) [Deinococcus aetherius]|uniref:Uncharacterized protein n=1 Tax=Deinococcus aetherius TaxID=200252 RepID=A0ABN6RMZ6_9DEIO|nr:hypothetical protein [Deinococcus aetherius]BDP44668.1 hypothetical protein DAETH_46370 [Deinococcus aetherius]
MLEADGAIDPGTVGFVPPVTFDQVNAYYTEVGRWLGYASEAGHDPDFELPARTLPAKLPKWSPVEPCPRPHLAAMIATLDALRLHAEAAVHHLEKATPEADAPKLARLRGQFEGALSKANLVSGMYRPGASLALHEQVEEHAKGAIEGLYRAGQLISYLALLTEGGRSVSPARRRARPPFSVRPCPGSRGLTVGR